MPEAAGKSFKTRRQAVLVIHGMGEQVPLETMRSFVETVYQRDDELGAQQTSDAELGRVNRVWLIPDTATGSAELRKISTAPRTGDRLRTDFYEFYWADIMEGTPIEAVYAWVRGLILRSPWAVPRSIRVWIAFLALWALTIAFVLNTLATFDPSGGMAEGMLSGIRTWLAANHAWIGIVVGGLGVAKLVIGLMGARNLARVKVTLPVVLIGMGLVLLLAPQATLEDVKAWSALFALVSAALLGGIIAPFVGDVVRYVRATPTTVQHRQQVRERGLALLRALHDKKEVGGTPYYERIVVVAHSLGTMIAYDLIQLYWQAEGPGHLRAPVAGLKAPLDAIDGYVADWWVTKPEERKPFPLAAFQKEQSRVFEAMVLGGVNFRISDFITLGSPLTHSEFLLKDDKDALEQEFEQRGLSSSPPRPDWPSPKASFMQGKRGPFTHYAAPFSAVRWTNLYDLHWFPLFGDIVSGPLRPSFGPGIDEHRVRITRPGWLPIVNRFVTHTLYWSWHKSYSGKTNAQLPEHIRLLREAMQLKGDIETRSL